MQAVDPAPYRKGAVPVWMASETVTRSPAVCWLAVHACNPKAWGVKQEIATQLRTAWGRCKFQTSLGYRGRPVPKPVPHKKSNRNKAQARNSLAVLSGWAMPLIAVLGRDRQEDDAWAAVSLQAHWVSQGVPVS